MTDQESDFPDAWRPNPGDTINGTMVGVELIDPAGQGTYPCLTIRQSSGVELNVHAFHQVLKSQLAKRRPKPGDEITIMYHGKKAAASGRDYHSYRVLGGEGQSVDWDSFLPEGERPATPLNVVNDVPAPAQPAPVAPTPAQDDLEDLPF